jgi:hypothetical protein
MRSKQLPFFLLPTSLLLATLLQNCANDNNLGSNETQFSESSEATQVISENPVIAEIDSVPLQLTHLWQVAGSAYTDEFPTVAIGATGSNLFSNINGSTRTSLYSANKVTGSPVIWANNPAGFAAREKVAAAAAADSYASISFEISSQLSGNAVIPRVRLWHSGNPTAVWTKTFAPANNGGTIVGIPANVHISKDGSKIIAWYYNNLESTTYIVGFNANGDQLFLSSSLTWQPPLFGTVDENLNRLILTFQTGTYLYSGANGVAIMDLTYFYNPTKAVAISPNGEIAAIGNIGGFGTGGIIHIYHTTSGSAALEHAYAIPGVPDLIPVLAALSKDGATLAVVYQLNTDTQSLRLKIFSLGATQATEIFTHLSHGEGAYPAFFTDLAISSQGDVVAVGTTGDQNHTIPELMIFNKGVNGYQLVQTANFSGSVTDIVFSPDERILGVISSQYHSSATTYQLKYLDAYALYDEFNLLGVPHVGTMVQISQRATPGATCTFYKSTSLASIPTVMGDTGNLLLQTPVPVGTAIADAQGVASFNIAVSAAEAGQTVFYQGLKLGESIRRLTKHAIPLTAVP